jgi:DnaJ-class molecular chaperone
MAAKDYYLILGVTRAGSKSGIREAFRELAKRYHPDHVGSQGTTFFQELVEAYEVLSNPTAGRSTIVDFSTRQDVSSRQRRRSVLGKGHRLNPWSRNH